MVSSNKFDKYTWNLPVLSEQDADDSPAFTDDESGLDDEEKTINGDIGNDGSGNQQAQKKTVAQIMRDKKKQTGMTLNW